MKLRSLALYTLLSSSVLPYAAAQTPVATTLAASALTAVPPLVPYTGIVEGHTGPISVTFLIYKDQTGGEPLFTETQTVAIDATNHYKVQLGGANPNGLPSELFSTGEARWLEVQVAGQEQQPRILLASVPYALKAADAATLGGLPASAFALAGSNSVANGVTTTDVSSSPITNATSIVTTNGGTINKLAKFSTSTNVASSTVYDDGTNVGIHTTVPTATLTVSGTTTLEGQLLMPAQGTATASGGFNSQALKFNASSYNSSSKTAVVPRFAWQAEFAGNNTSSPNATLNLVASPGTPALTETGFYFNTNGTIHFAPAQTFPGGTGTGTITGVGAGTALTGGGTSGNVTLRVDTTKVPLLASNNAFAGTQTIGGNLLLTGNIGVGTTTPEANIDIESANSGQPLLISAKSGGAWAINSFGGPNGGLAGRFVGGEGTDGNTGGAGISVGGGSTGDNGTGGVGAYFGGGSSYTGNAGDGIDVSTGNLGTTREGYAGYFTGDVDVTENLFAAAKYFRVDHPLDPANKYLNHVSIESSEMMNLYSGNVTTDGSGLSTVSLPDWFETVNTDFRYQLTVVGQFAQAIIKSKIANGKFTIMTNTPNVEVSWQITAVRQDVYAKAHHVDVEQEKPANEKGFYIHPALYGQPETKQTEWGRHPQQMQQMKQMRDARRPGVDTAQMQKP